MRVQRIGDVTAIRDQVEVPGLGGLPINAFVVHAEQPVLVDTGRPVARAEFMAALESVIDPADIRWIWLSHPDRDHMGSLFDVLDRAPQARLVSTFLAVGYLTVEFEMPFHRLQLVNPGQSLDVGAGRRLHAFRPPLFDSPMTVGFYDDAGNYAFSSDCFGAPMPTADEAAVDDIRALPSDVVRQGQLLWATADSPWVSKTDPARFAATYDELRRRAPELVLSTHLPPASGQLDTFVEMLGEAPHAPEFVGPDQAALEAMLGGPVTLPEQSVGEKTPV